MNWIRLAAFILTASVGASARGVSPHDGAVGSCSPSYNGKFEVTISKLGKRDIEVSNILAALSQLLVWTTLM